ncbi:MAG: hypothetical protein LKE53_06840 [Oscillospiraceae bacterium]|nr:hypothetical protein [Oscillospiraceae bacterium]MDD3260735.1 hypothetical protein [Oscillospiraceae bacterium]
MSHPQFQWARLDTAAKIFPCTSSTKDPKVFRFVCELKEPIVPQALQQALDQTIELFPGFQTILKRGMFWYYLEQTNMRPTAHEECRPPCSVLYDRDVHTLLFDVTYYGCRVNLEVFHAISDGTGSMHFLRVLIFRYLQLVHPKELGSLPELDYDASETQSMDDSFERYANRQKKPKTEAVHRAAHLHGNKRTEGLNVVVGTAPVNDLLAYSHRCGASMTMVLCALIMQAIRSQMSVNETKKPVVLAVPVNLRNHFRSASARNFFSVMDVSYNFSKRNGSMEDILQELERQFQRGLSPEELQYRVNQYIGLIKNPFSRITPLSCKDFAMRLGYYSASQKETSAVSNVGVVHMPAALAPYIRQFAVFVSTEKLQMCSLSYENRITLSFSSAFANTDVQRCFFRSLIKEGIPVEIDTNLCDE